MVLNLVWLILHAFCLQTLINHDKIVTFEGELGDAYHNYNIDLARAKRQAPNYILIINIIINFNIRKSQTLKRNLQIPTYGKSLLQNLPFEKGVGDWEKKTQTHLKWTKKLFHHSKILMLTAKKKKKQKQKTLCIKFDHSIVAYNKLGKNSSKLHTPTPPTPLWNHTYWNTLIINANCSVNQMSPFICKRKWWNILIVLETIEEQNMPEGLSYVVLKRVVWLYSVKRFLTTLLGGWNEKSEAKVKKSRWSK